MSNSIIDPTAIIDKSVKIGPFCVIGPNVEIGPDCVLHSHVVIKGPTKINEGNVFYQFSTIGEDTPDKKYDGEDTTLEIGKNNRLGVGDFVFNTLYNVNHTAKLDRKLIDTGRTDEKGNKIVINAKNGEENIKTSFDKNKTYFDKKFTYFAFEDDDNGAVYIYEDVNGTYVYGDAISYTSTHGPVYYFGRDCKVIQNHVYVALPKVKNSKGNIGTIVDFSITNNVYSFIRQAQDTVDVTKIKRIILYNKETQTLVKYLDYIDPLQGKIAGPAEQNLSYKLYYDPAVYTISNIENVRADETDRWAGKHLSLIHISEPTRPY